MRLQSVTANTITGNTSKSIGDILSYVRVLCVYDKAKSDVRFYAGTEDVTDTIFGDTAATFNAGHSAHFRFGSTYKGDMLESRIWTKALTQEEIAATANHTLTGYERELLAYYRMDEGKGETVTDYAHGATLYLDGCSWNKQQGFSLRLSGDSVQLDGNLLGRSAVYDMTMMLWFKAEKSGTLFRSSQQQWSVPDGYADGNWHHWVLTVSRTYNNAALFVDGKMVQTFDAAQLDGFTGAMYLGGDGFKGNIDEFVIFEQALPKSLVELFDNVSLAGDEMGLVGYLPFEEQYLTPSGVLQQRFSGNDKRVFKNPETGEVIDKIVPLVISDVTGMEDGENNAPVKSHGLLNKLYFNWSFNNNELMINILNRDYEVNKQSIYVTVRDVEDLNGNPMVSPVTWTAFVDRNSLKWSEKKIEWRMTDDQSEDQEVTVRIINQSGKRHQYNIESLPSWLTVDTEYGSIDPTEEQSVVLTFNGQTAVGEYSDIIYLTDEDGLSEPLHIEYTVEAIPPYDDIDEGKYPYSMSVCAQVQITAEDGSVYDTDERDIVYALYRNECVGQANVTLNPVSNATDVYLSVLGNDQMTLKLIHFQLWQASTGKLYDLTASRNVLFLHGYVYGCGDTDPLMLTTGGSQRQQIELNAGWNWASVNLDLTATKGGLDACMSAAKPWTNGDLIKNPRARTFSIYDEANDVFVGSLTELHYSQVYMIYSATENTMRISGETLPEDSMKVTVRGDGLWSALPCLFDQRTPLTEALADYYDNASAGDLIKGHNRFATFTSDKRWVGDLQALRPGEGYFFRRMAKGAVSIAFYKKESKVESRKSKAVSDEHSAFSNPNAATNMTMIAAVRNQNSEVRNQPIKVYVGDELAAVAEPIDSLYFLTIQSDKVGELRFEMDGEALLPFDISTSRDIEISNKADSHHGSLKAPVILRPQSSDDSQPSVYKVIEDEHVVIIRQGEKYDVTGVKLNR